jgi:ADP-ribose pyrophosphatase YjhB (NUDIX family)
MTTRTYTHPDVFTLGPAQGWAETETDPARINWPERQARAAIPFTVVDGRPVNPCEKTAVRYGRNEMGYWGETLMADALVTGTWQGTRYLLMIERGDGYGWAVPGGHVEAWDFNATSAALRELQEETGLTVIGYVRTLPARYVPDPRSSDEAWAVTIPVDVYLGACDVLPEVTGADDARRARWIRADTYQQLTGRLADRYGGRVFAAHTAMLTDFLGTENH